MKILIIGDCHCRFEMIEAARDIHERTPYDKIVFLGDYCDSFTHSNLDMFHTLNQVVQFKCDYPDVVILLLGNHDFTYLHNGEYKCSGFRADALPTVYAFFQQNKEHFDIAWQYENHLFTHAGVTNAWYDTYKEFLAEISDEEDDIATQLNKCLRTSKNWILYSVGQARGGMRYEKGGPLWADKQEAYWNSLIGYHQYCGHTPIKEKVTEFGEDPNTTSITFLDTWPHDVEFKKLDL